MAMVNIFEVGKYGIIQDIRDHEMPPEAWTRGRNIRFVANGVERMPGHDAIFPPEVPPYAPFFVPLEGSNYWVYCGLEAAYSVIGATHNDISISGGYSATENIPWTGGLTNGILVLNNGIDQPQEWTLNGATTLLKNLSNWDSDLRCKVLRPYREFLVALDLTDSGTNNPYAVRWSAPAEPRSVPPSWDIADPTVDAGQFQLSDTPGKLLDCLALGDTNIVYKSDATWSMRWVGGSFVMKFDKIFSETGMLTHRCAAVIPRRGHFVVTDDDVVWHDGRLITSVIEDKVRTALFKNIDQTNYIRSFVVPNYPQREMWFCYPQEGFSYPNRALIWNYNSNKITYRDVPSVTGGGIGLLTPDIDPTWNADSEVWNLDSTAWNETGESATTRRLLLASPAEDKLFRPDETNQFDGTNYEAFVERTGLAIAGVDRSGAPKVDITLRKLFKRLWIRAEGAPFEVQVGMQERIDGPVTWGSIHTFDPSVDTQVTIMQSGRAMAIRFQSTGNHTWKLQGYSVELERLGTFL